MPYAVTHILVVIILVELFRNYFLKNNHKFPRYYILIAAIGAILPDLDFLAFYALSFFGFTYEQIHRTFMHSLFVPLILFLVGLFILKMDIKFSFIRKRHLKLSMIFFILTFGSLIHLILDSLFAGSISPFYPLVDFDFGLNLIELFPAPWQSSIPAMLDGALIMIWIFWMEFKLKISDYF